MDNRNVTTHKTLHTNDTQQQVQDNKATVQDRPSQHTCQPENQIRTVASEVCYTTAASFVDVWMDRLINEQTDQGNNEFLHGWTNKLINEWVNGWLDSLLVEWIHELFREWIFALTNGRSNELMDSW
jgi:hypothetical protein